MYRCVWGIYNISTLVGYLMPNPVNTYKIYIYKRIYVTNILNKPEIIYLYTVK